MWPAVDSGRRWIRCLPGTTHNHAKPKPYVISQSVKDEIHNAIKKKDYTPTTKQLQRGHGHGFLPAEKSPAAFDLDRVGKESQLALISRSEIYPGIVPLLQDVEFDKFRKPMSKCKNLPIIAS